jgi:hypothetical protein
LLIVIGGTDDVYGMVYIAAVLHNSCKGGYGKNTCGELSEVHHTPARKAGKIPGS